MAAKPARNRRLDLVSSLVAMRDVRAQVGVRRWRETTPLFGGTFQCCCVIVKAALSHMITRLTKLIRQHESRQRREKKKDKECTYEQAA